MGQYRNSGARRLLPAAVVLGAVCVGCNTAGHAKEADAPSATATAMETASVENMRGFLSEGGGMSLKETLLKRRSIRSFKPRTLSEREVADLCFAAQGVTSPQGYRTAPSAGATYPLVLHIVARNGVFGYDPATHRLSKLSEENRTRALSEAALGQRSVAEAGANFVFGAMVERTASRYGEKARRFVDIEAGCAAENLMLMATALGLGSVMIGAQDEARVKTIATLPAESEAVLMVSVGMPK